MIKFIVTDQPYRVGDVTDQFHPESEDRLISEGRAVRVEASAEPKAAAVPVDKMRRPIAAVTK